MSEVGVALPAVAFACVLVFFHATEVALTAIFHPSILDWSFLLSGRFRAFDFTRPSSPSLLFLLSLSHLSSLSSLVSLISLISLSHLSSLISVLLSVSVFHLCYSSCAADCTTLSTLSHQHNNKRHDSVLPANHTHRTTFSSP
eukprot:c9832_g1_i1.p1 GENE.c9832_g1_i1~~c9832_g1_i1.p1  ORF type:complete len:159 (+),score=11.44 c9832_g1_i1:50-478(+)